MPTWQLDSWSTSASAVKEIDASYRFLYVGFSSSATTSYTQLRHDAVNNFWQTYGKERLILYQGDVISYGGGIFAGATGSSSRVTVLSMLGMQYLAPAATTNTLIFDSEETGSSVMRYLTEDGPFGAADIANISYVHDTYRNGADPTTLPATAVPVLVDADNGAVVLMIDPGNGLIYMGEAIIGSGYSSVAQMEAGTGDDKSRFFANLIAYMVNCAQYGSGFADLFIPGNEALYEAAFPPAQVP